MTYMYKVFIAVLAAAMLAACSGEKAGVWTELSGEWNVIEIDGTRIVADSLANRVYVGFSPADSSVFGCTGCNLLMARTGQGDDPTVADFSNAATTMMAGPGLEVESVFLPAFREVKSYYAVGEDRIEFSDASGNTRMVLEKAL